MKIKKRSNLLKFIPVLAFLIVLGACSKSEPTVVEPEPDPVAPEAMFNRLITVKNFGEYLPAGSAPTTEQSPIYYSLEQNKAITSDYVGTVRWDMSFSGLFRSFINCNNTANGFGKGGPGKGGILIVEKKFEDVIDIPLDAEFRKGEKAYGTDNSGDFGEGLGWYLYDFYGTFKGGGAENKKHVAYPIEGHTIIVRTAQGNYAKIKMQSIYKDLLDPKDWFKDSPTPFFTFQYVLAKAGSTKFTITN
ncbi:HmuY family protein [Sphingobacterium sp. UBA5996]|uniref:HmuY family protein n=1 Tax=Sphingobacterium sp. UBA5996 TaxID=1947505 RepID=UPI0025D15C14|nr:HmuY family protein [Sphingobacterium sp. UBA5996]